MKKYSSRYLSLLILAFFTTLATQGQNARFKPVNPDDSIYQVSGKKLILPAALIGFGFSQFSLEPVRSLNLNIRSQFTSRVTQPLHIDNYSQYVPALAVYGLNLAGVKGRHNFLDRTVIIATAGVITGLSVEGIKLLTHVERPDGSSFDAFPSGHTATAFACAEFLYQEYKDVSPWYGVAGYAVAAGTGFLRMYNNRHWFTDVVAGAAFGMLSTKIAYWIFPKIKRLYSKDFRLTLSFIPPTNLSYVPVR